MPPEFEHVCGPEICPAPGNYYVSAVDGDRWWLMAGPYESHSEALAAVSAARSIANEHDGRAWFMGWGTCRMPDNYREPGNLNRAGLIRLDVMA